MTDEQYAGSELPVQCETTENSGLGLAACPLGFLYFTICMGILDTFLFVLSNFTLDKRPPAWPS